MNPRPATGWSYVVVKTVAIAVPARPSVGLNREKVEIAYSSTLVDEIWGSVAI